MKPHMVPGIPSRAATLANATIPEAGSLGKATTGYRSERAWGESLNVLTCCFRALIGGRLSAINDLPSKLAWLAKLTPR